MNPCKARKLVAAIKQQYNSQIMAYGDTRNMLRPGRICVGGCLIHYQRNTWYRRLLPFVFGAPLDWGFPDAMEIATALIRENQDLPFPIAHEFAMNIVHNNDTSCFDRAFTYMEAALQWPWVHDSIQLNAIDPGEDDDDNSEGDDTDSQWEDDPEDGDREDLQPVSAVRP